LRGPITERLFIAVGLPSDVGAALEETARRLAPYWPSGVVRWTTAGNQHLTLRFLGDTRPEQVAKLKVVMDEVVAGQPPFELHLDGTGTFPPTGPARVLWAGLRSDDGRRALTALQQRLEGRVRDLGCAAESRPYRPHLTLGRVRRGAPPSSGEWQRHAPKPMVIPVDEILLMRSELHKTGARYTTLHTACLVA
jgi:2'-5' RNA ligase